MSVASRKLATILALDAAGYSRQSEIDEAGAIREIAALGERVRASAAAHGGRVFNTAGDGFMLEFPTASGAIACAEEILAASRLPLRLGAHIGEVTQTPTGDLLGRGVNVAARLQALAAPGEILLSGEVKSALGRPLAARLQSRGPVKLDKMDEGVEAHALGARWAAPARRMPQVSQRAAWIGAGAFAALALIAAAALAPEGFQPRAERVAVLDFDTADPALAPFAGNLADQIIAVMSVSDLQALPRGDGARFRGDALSANARQAGVAFVLDGVISENAGETRVSMHVIDARANLTLWSNAYTRTIAERAALQEQVAAHAAGVLRCALVSRRPRAGEIAPQTLATFLRACDRVRNFDRNPEEMLEAARQVTERAPGFSRGWSMLALASAFASRAAPAAEAERLRAQTRDAAARAQRLDRGNAESYLALAAILPLLGHWRERQALIDRALRLEPHSADALMLQGELLAELGRISEALVYFRRAVSLEPLSPSYWSILTPALATLGQHDEVAQLHARMNRTWPESPSAWYNTLAGASFVGDPAVALRLLDDSAAAPLAMEQPLREAWRRFLLARMSGNRADMRAATEEFATLARKRQLDIPRAMAAAATMNELDIAFALAREYLESGAAESYIEQPIGGAGRYALFLGATRSLRADPRFLELARDVGLVAHWRETGHWPDFCADPAIPYDCRAES